MDIYREEILEHYKYPHNFGDLSGKTHSAKGVNASCGDMVEVYLKIKGSVIIEAAFRGVGCAVSTAAASMLTEELKGKTVMEVKSWGDSKMFELLGEVNPGRMKCVRLPLAIFQEAADSKLVE